MTPKTTIKYKGVDIPIDTYQAMLDKGLVGEKHDTVQPTFMQNPHGFSQQWTSPPQGGLFTRPGVRPDMYSAIPAVLGGLLSRLWAGVTDEQQPEYDIITGVDAADGSNPTGYCGTAPTAGDMKVGTHRSQFGKYFMSTEKITVNEAGGRVNNADIDRTLINMIAAQHPLLPQILANPNINSEIGNAIYRFSIHTLRVWSRTMFGGNYTKSNVNTQIGFIREFDGWDRLLKTGYTDRESDNVMPAADSIIMNFNNADATVAANGIVDMFSDFDYQITKLARDTGLDPLTYSIGMRAELFWALTKVWPCSYLTNNCGVENTTTGRVTVGGAEQVQMRDEMRQGEFLWINGKRVPVSVEDGIAQTTGGVGFDTTVYFIPEYAGGRKVSYIEAFNQDNTGINEILQAARANSNFATSNGGLWMTTNQQTGFCLETLFAAQPRLVCRTPFLGGRIENVRYKLTNGYPRSSYPNEPYYASGGRYTSSPYSTG